MYITIYIKLIIFNIVIIIYRSSPALAVAMSNETAMNYICIYIYIYLCICIYTYMYIYLSLSLYIYI